MQAEPLCGGGAPPCPTAEEFLRYRALHEAHARKAAIFSLGVRAVATWLARGVAHMAGRSAKTENDAFLAVEMTRYKSSRQIVWQFAARRSRSLDCGSQAHEAAKDT